MDDGEIGVRAILESWREGDFFYFKRGWEAQAATSFMRTKL